MDPRATLAAAMSTASDGFFLNLSWVLLRLCVPFSSQGGGAKRSARIASIDPTYCTVAAGTESRVVDFREESKLVPGVWAGVVCVWCVGVRVQCVCVCLYAYLYNCNSLELCVGVCVV